MTMLFTMIHFEFTVSYSIACGKPVENLMGERIWLRFV